MNDLAHCLEDSTQRELQAQLYRYAEDMYLLMSEHDALQQRFRALDQAHRSVSEYRELLSLLMHSPNEAYLATDGDGRIIHHTRPASQLLGAEDLAGSFLGAFIADDELPDFVAWLGNASGKAEAEEVRRIRLRHDGERPPAAEAFLIRCPSPDPCHRHWIVRPRLEHNSVDTPVSTDERNGSGIFVSDDKGRILTVNAAFTRITGHPAETVRGESLQQLIHAGSDSENFFRQLWEQLRVAGSWQGEISNRRRNGETYPQWLALDCIRNGDGSITGYFARIHDLSRLQDSERQLSRLAYYDFLTGLPNRLLFNDRLTMAINQSRRDGRQMGVLFLDLDRFKQINDTLGHDVGDELLKIVAERLTGATREADTVARLGGDEFTVILPKLQGERDVHAVAAKILEMFQPPVLLAGQTLFATPSIGVAIFPDHGNDASTLLRHADSAMYRAKNDGGNMYHLFEAADDGDSRVLSIESAFRNALARNELYLVYQPQIAANGCAIHGVEALLRWRSPEFGEVSPGTFIPIAEWSGMILEIGQWVLHSACRQAALWRQSGLPIQRVAVNISPRQLRAPDFSTWVLQALADSGLPGEALELEITESELMLYPESTLIKLAELRSRGVSVAIDDFGTGYSSLARLRSLPIDRIKVDRSFVRDLENDGDAQAISSCIVTMARVMNIEVVAEGVETTGQLRYLLDQGCHTIQGFLFAQPMPPEAIGNYLASLLQSEEDRHESGTS